MRMRLVACGLVWVIGSACGSRRVAGYLAELEDSGVTSGTAVSSAVSMGEGSSTGAGETNGTVGESGGSGNGSSGEAMTGSSSGSGEETGGSSGEAMAACGNGVVEKFGAEPEECDDGNLDPEDGCNAACALDRHVFVTSKLYQGGDPNGLYLADAQCANRADDAGWPDGLKYRAWLSDSTTDAKDRFKRGRGRLLLMNGQVFAQSWEALLAGELERPLEVTEKKTTYHGGVWTGTRVDGTAVPGAQHCEDWKTESIFTEGHYGYSDLMTAEWTLSDDPDQPENCTASLAIYCFQSL